MTIGLDVDKNDNVWVFHRPQTLEQKESYATRGEADCCTAAPDVLEFDPTGNLIKHWGRDQVKGNGRDWPSSNHGITLGPDGNIWLGGNGAYQPGPPPGSAAQFASKPNQPAPAPFREGGGEVGIYHDSFVLKFSPDGKFLGEIGKANGSKGSLDTENVRGVAQIRFLPGTNEIVLADGYGNKRISVWDAATLKFKRMWGAYRHVPDDSAPRDRRTRSAITSASASAASAISTGVGTSGANVIDQFKSDLYCPSLSSRAGTCT